MKNHPLSNFHDVPMVLKIQWVPLRERACTVLEEAYAWFAGVVSGSTVSRQLPTAKLHLRGKDPKNG
jgi:hypothetical protein